MKKVAIITNLPSPYRVAFFNHMIENYPEYEFHIIYSIQKSGLHEWESEKELNNSIFLKNRKITLKTKHDKREVFFTLGTKKALKKINPDVIVAAEYNITAQKALSYAKKKKIPFVSWSDATKLSEREISSLQMRLRRRVIKHADAFIASSTRTKELQIEYGAPAEKIFVSLLTVDTEKYELKKTEYPKSIIFVGRNVPIKGLDLLVNALTSVKNDFTLHLVGPSELDSQTAAVASKSGFADKIICHGFITPDKIKEIYKESGIFILPSRQDCFALVILEAMCASMPVLVSNYADGAYDLMRDGENGYMFDPYNEKETAEKIDALLSDENLRKEFGARSHEMSKAFGLAPSAADYIKTIDFVLKGN